MCFIVLIPLDPGKMGLASYTAGVVCFFFCLQGFQFHHNMLVIDCNLGIGSINCWGLMCVINAMGDISVGCQKLLSSSYV